MIYAPKPLKAALFLLAGILLYSCGGGTAEQPQTEEMKDSSMAEKPVQATDDAELSYVLPSPAQIAGIFKKSGLKYYSGITNGTENLSKYKAGSASAKALNLGVYSTDLAYCIFNKQSQETKNYYKVCHDMADQVGLKKAFEGSNDLTWLEKNITNTDSLTRLLVNVQMETDNILGENGQEHVSVLLFAGAWVESMYLGMRVNAKEKNFNISAKLVEQMSIADNIIKALKVNTGKDPGIEPLLKQMSSLSEIYNNFSSVKEMKAKDPDVIDPAKLNIGITEIFSFSSRLEEIRASIIKG